LIQVEAVQHAAIACAHYRDRATDLRYRRRRGVQLRI